VVRRRLGRAVAITLAVVAGLVAAGCGIPTQSEPSAIPSNRVPLGLVSPTLPSTTTTQPRTAVNVTIYLLSSSGGLVPRQRVVQVPAPLRSVLTALFAGPDQSEAQLFIGTAIPTDVSVIGVKTQDSVVTVNLNEAFGEITGTNTELAVAQVVATVVAQSGSNSTGVVFEIDGEQTEVPVASGAQVSGPVYLLQFLKAGS
jgi:spore germination protein GerM